MLFQSKPSLDLRLTLLAAPHIPCLKDNVFIRHIVISGDILIVHLDF
jgi:hypothetical protein